MLNTQYVNDRRGNSIPEERVKTEGRNEYFEQLNVEAEALLNNVMENDNVNEHVLENLDAESNVSVLEITADLD